MVQCSVLGCKNRSEQKQSTITFHRFPFNDEILNKWIKGCGRVGWKPTQHSRICSKHFDDAFLLQKGQRNFLLPNAVPTKYICTSDMLSKPSSSSRGQECNRKRKCNIPFVKGDMHAKRKLLELSESQVKQELNVSCQQEENTKYKLSIKDTARMKQLEKLSENRLKKLRTARQANRRLTKRIADLSNIITELKTKIS